MNKSELIEAIVAKTEQTKASAAAALDATVAAIQEAVAGGDTVTLVGFGTFKSAPRAAREGKNPRTGETVKIAATVVPRFTPGASFKEKVAASKAKAKKK